MADVTGPISSLPGSRHAVPEGMKCDYHPERDATVRVQGETDSMGCEMADLCDECAKDILVGNDHIGTCDWCKASEMKLRPRRDYDEGMSGPVYYVCEPCITRSNQRLEQELEERMGGYYDDWI